LLLEGAREKLDQAALRQVVVTAMVTPATNGWSKLHVVPVAPLVAGAVRRFVADHWLGDLF
jgi:phosphoribosylpyrophosphate synthetase